MAKAARKAGATSVTLGDITLHFDEQPTKPEGDVLDAELAEWSARHES
jgi:hypothetical protein